MDVLGYVLGGLFLALLAWSVLSALRNVEDHLWLMEERIMARIDEKAAESAAKADRLLAKVGEGVITLRELKALVEQGQNTDNAEAVLAAMDARIDEGLASLTAAEDETDPTPDTPPDSPPA